MNRQNRHPSRSPFQPRGGYPPPPPPPIRGRRPPIRGVGGRPLMPAHRLPPPPMHPGYYPPPPMPMPIPMAMPPQPYPSARTRRPGYETMASEKAAMDVLAAQFGLKLVDDDLDSLSGSEGSQTPKESSDKDAEEEERLMRDAPVGSISNIKSLYQGPPDYQGRTQWLDRYPDDVEEAAETEQTAKFALIARKKKCFDGRKKFDIDSIIVNSPDLKRVLGQVFKEYPGVTCELNRLVFENPFQPFVHGWTEFVEAMEKETDVKTKEHLELLHSILKEELKDTIKALEDYFEHGVTTFEHLWAMFQPGAPVHVTRSGSSCAMAFISGNYAKTDNGDAFEMSLESIGYSGTGFGRAIENVDVYAFSGTRPINALNACPLSFHPEKEAIGKMLIGRGKKYEALAGYHYKAYDGVALSWDSRGKQIPLTVSGRIIVDAEAFDRFNPDRMEIFNDLKEEDFTIAEIPEVDVKTTNKIKNDYDVVQVSPEVQLTENSHLICKSTVTGYSLKLKKWLNFFVDCIDEIEWNDNAFETLVLHDDTKELLMSFVESQIENKATFDDVIQGKGKGIIMLLSGPPGVGKTLTAESVAESMHIPLYMMSAGDLGLRPDEVEESLQDILEMVAKWNAILLLDECDVFLEERTTQELERNKLVSIFLRTLEYYEGILFLTTNRVSNMDPAFQSRIHVSLAYPDLDTLARRQVWANFLTLKGNKSEISERDLDILAEVKLNGRQIKNVIKTAFLLSLRKKTPLKLENIRTILAIEGRRPDTG